MLAVILAGLVLLVIGAVIPSDPPTYGSKLEEYIVSRNPRDTYDVEHLTREFDEKQKQGIL